MKILSKRYLSSIATIVTFSFLAFIAGGSAVFALTSTDLFFNVNASDPGSYSTSAPGTWRDLSAANRNGTINGSVTYNAGDGALVFPGRTDSYVDMGSGFNNFGSGITIEFEGHFGGGPGFFERIFDFGNGPSADNIWVGSYGTNNALTLEMWNPVSGTQTGLGRCRSADLVLTPFVFDRYVITLDGTTCRMYKNGTEINTVVDGPAKEVANGTINDGSFDYFYDTPSANGSAYPFLPSNVTRTKNYIGKSNWTQDAAFDGAIKYVRIYTTAISSNDVTNNSTTYTLTYSSTGATSGTEPAAITGNGLVTLSSNTGTLTKTGHTFEGWATSSGQTSGATGSYDLTANTTLYPAFAPNRYNVTYDEQNGSPVTDGSYAYGGSFTYPSAPTKAGYSFTGWFDAISGGSALSESTVSARNSSVTLHAQWAPNSYNVVYDENGGSDVADGSYTFGSNLTYPATPTKTGHTFLGWFDATSGGSALLASAVDDRTTDSTLHAQWSANTYNVTFDEHGGSSVADGSYRFGNAFTYPANPTLSGYNFSGWFDTASGGSPLLAATISARTAHSALHAQWDANTYTVTYDEHGGSTVADGSYVFGNILVFPTAPTRDGYRFDGWFTSSSGGSAQSASAVSAGTTNAVLHAQWTALPVQTITWSPSNSSVLTSQSPVTPSSLASTSGDGAITYSVASAGATGCSVNSTTGVVTFSGVGICTVRATASSTASYVGSYRDVDYNVSSSAPALSLNLGMTSGATVANSMVDYGASGLQANSAWSLVLRSTPQTIASGTYSNTVLSGSAQIPSGLPAGWHSITLTGIGANGSTLSHAVWFEVSSSGTLLQTSGSDPAPVDSTVVADSGATALSLTGANTESILLLSALVLLLGASLLTTRRLLKR